MAFILNGTAVVSFSEYQDCLDMDQRLFETNEGLTEEVIEDALIRSTARILTLLRATDWWQSYYIKRATDVTYQTIADVPALDAAKIAARQDDFTDLCVYYAFWNYVLPKIADFATEDNAERQKISFYQQKYNNLFGELISAGDWYNFDGTGTISSSEKQPGYYNLKRVR